MNKLSKILIVILTVIIIFLLMALAFIIFHYRELQKVKDNLAEGQIRNAEELYQAQIRINELEEMLNITE